MVALLVLLVQILDKRRDLPKVCINVSMKYGYQIQATLENNNADILGFRVIVVTDLHFFNVDVPAELFDRETLRYLKFRMGVSSVMDIRKLPPAIQNKIRAPLGRYLDYWVLENINGNHSTRKNTNA